MPLTTKQHTDCIKEILLLTFKDRRLLANFFLGLVALIVGIFSTLAGPFLLKKGVESFSEDNSSVVIWILLSYGFVWLLSQTFLHIRALLTYKIEQRITFVLGLKVLSHLYTLSQSYFLNQKPGAITNIIRRAQRDIPSLILGIFFHVIPTVFEFTCVIILISYLYPLSYSFLLGGTLIAFFIYTFYSMKSVLKDREIANEVDKNVDGVITDWLLNQETIKTSGQEKQAINVCERELKKRENAEVTFMTTFSFIHLGQSLILGFGLTALTYLVGQGVLNKTFSIGDFILFNGYILQFITPISILGQVTQDIKRAFVDLKDVLKILLTESEVKEASSPYHLSSVGFSLEFKNVSFSYKDRVIFDNLSFRVEPGETLLVVGSTGIGKSTLAKLILRLYDPTKGQVQLSDTDLTQISFSSLYKTIGWVPQESALFNDTIENNLRFVQPKASQKEIEEALDRANLLSFINNLPDGINTVVGDRGLKLSGGEKQRLSLARLFLKQPKICIFDEATSFLDRETELTIQSNIEKYLPHMTKIIITHRPFMVDRVHKVIVLDEKNLTHREVNYQLNYKHNPTNQFFLNFKTSSPTTSPNLIKKEHFK